MSTSIFSIFLFLSFITRSQNIQYKCYKDICNTLRQFCNDYEQRCENCGMFECNGENNFVKFDQCHDACKRIQSTSTTAITTTTELQSTNNGMSVNRIVPFATLFVVVVILIFVVIPVITSCKKKYSKIKWKPKDKVREPLLNEDIEMGYRSQLGPQTLPTNCTEDNDKYAKLAPTPSAPPSYESERCGLQPTTSEGPSETHPMETNFLAENDKCQEATESQEVTPKYVE